jgi:DNA-binding GntR family transcriptional regulator
MPPFTSNPPPRRNERTLVDQAADALREAILTGDLAPGQRVHLTDAATGLGMSMVPVREALRTLCSEGLVIAIPQRGYRVSPVSAEDLEDTYRLRRVLDPMATAFAVPRMTDADLDQLRDAMGGLQRAYDTHDLELRRAEHHRFHFTIYNASGSPWLIRFLEMLWAASYRYQRLSAAKRGSLAALAAEHRQILEACERRDAELASVLMRRHLELTQHAVELVPTSRLEVIQ